MKNVLIVHNGHEITAESQYLCLTFLDMAKEEGFTSREIEEATKKNHGTISGALSRLQEMGLISQLDERRNKYRVYVLIEHVNGRDTVLRHHFKDNSDAKELYGALENLTRSHAFVNHGNSHASEGCKLCQTHKILQKYQHKYL